jgi:hypothetical protein
MDEIEYDFLNVGTIWVVEMIGNHNGAEIDAFADELTTIDEMAL